MYRIKDLSQITGISSQTIRYYERIGILPPAKRTGNGYRSYAEADISRLNFLRRARRLDFPLSKVAEILAFRDQGEPPCRYVKELIENKIDELEDRIAELEQLRAELRTLQQMSSSLPASPSGTCICQIIETEGVQ